MAGGEGGERLVIPLQKAAVAGVEQTRYSVGSVSIRRVLCAQVASPPQLTPTLCFLRRCREYICR